jgi:hypothetical protein
MMLAEATNCRQWPCGMAMLCALALVISGCAGGAWLERSLESELPVDPPAKSYPTAVCSSIADVASVETSPATLPATGAMSLDAAQQHLPPNAASPQTALPPVNASRDWPQPLVTPLAVIPSQFVHPPPSATPPASAAVAPQTPVVARDTSPVPADISSYWTPSNVLSQFDAKVTGVAAAWQPPQQPAVAVLTASPTLPRGDIARANGTTEPAAPANDRQHRVERARMELIDALEAEIRQRRSDSTSDEELPRLEEQLRLAYLAAGRLDDAVTAVESLEPPQREAYKHLMFGLGMWLSPDEARRPPLRGAKVLHSLRDATGELAAASKLEVRNLMFCERVEYFGWYTEFPRKEFQPKQQVILYAEIENFAAEHKGPAGYETELQGSYEILDSSGQVVASRQLQLDKEICRNYRRDYFLAYRIYLPDGIAPGRYRLELTVEDLKARGKYQGRKLGEGMIEFTIR